MNDKHLEPEQTVFSCDHQPQYVTMTRKWHWWPGN